MFKYSFEYTGAATYSFNETFKPAKYLNIGGQGDYQLVRPFGSTDVFQLASGLRKAEPFILIGNITGPTTETDIITLSTALSTCTKLMSTDINDANEAYVPCSASDLNAIPWVPTAMRIEVYFWPTYHTWRLDSDDSETVI